MGSAGRACSWRSWEWARPGTPHARSSKTERPRRTADMALPALVPLRAACLRPIMFAAESRSFVTAEERLVPAARPAASLLHILWGVFREQAHSRGLTGHVFARVGGLQALCRVGEGGRGGVHSSKASLSSGPSMCLEACMAMPCLQAHPGRIMPLGACCNLCATHVPALAAQFWTAVNWFPNLLCCSGALKPWHGDAFVQNCLVCRYCLKCGRAGSRICIVQTFHSGALQA
jgi:hypothetical protein